MSGAGSPSSAAGAVWLASDDSSYYTGQTLQIDGTVDAPSGSELARLREQRDVRRVAAEHLGVDLLLEVATADVRDVDAVGLTELGERVLLGTGLVLGVLDAEHRHRPAAARPRIDAAKRALGERGPVWWTDGAPDENRRLARNTSYADWYASLPPHERRDPALGDPA